ncbi:unnamed protein product [Ixodes hexagonus]
MEHDSTGEGSSAFVKLKPFCVRLIKDQSVENVVALRRALEQLDKDSFQKLHEYVLFPLTLVLQNAKRTESLVIEAIGCICDVLREVRLTSWTVFSDLFLRLLVIVSSVKESLSVSSTSEEVKLAFATGLRSIIESADASLLTQMLDIEFRLCLGHAVTILLLLAEKERNRALQVLSMQCLMKLTCHDLQGSSSSDHMHLCSGNAFAGFLPGISIALTHVILNTENRSQRTVAVALNTWASVVEEVLSDQHLEHYKQKAASLEAEQKNLSGAASRVPRIERTDDWVKSTAEKLSILVHKVCPCLASCEPKTKMAALDWARVSLLSCKRSLETLAPPLLLLTLTLSSDDDQEVAAKSSSLLEEVAEQMTQDDTSLVEILEEDFYRALGKCPHVIWTGSDAEKLSLVKLLSGYLRIFRKSKVAKILVSPSVCQRLLNVLFLLTEFETGTMNLLAEQPASLDFTGATECGLKSYHRQFKHFVDIHIFKEFATVCRLLGCYGDVMLLADVLHQKITESATNRKQAILVLNHVLLAFKDRKDDISQGDELNWTGYLRSLLEYYISAEMWNLPLHSGTEFDGSRETCLAILSIDKMNSNILQNCLLLEGVATIALLLEAKFQPLLRVSLCPLLEKADSQNHLVSQTACTTLLRVARNCDLYMRNNCYASFSSISELIQENADYITDSLLFKLKHAGRHPDIPHIVQALTKHSDQNAISLIQDVGYEASCELFISLVLNALDFCHSENALPFLRTLGCIVLYVNRWFALEQKQNQPSMEDTHKQESSFRQFVEDFHRCKQVSENLEDLDEPANMEEEVPEETETVEKPEVPGHIKLLVQVLRRCIHLQSSSNIWVQTAVLTIVRHAVVPVSCCEDEVLPMVHLLWKPLVNRFQGDNCSLSIKAFETLTSLVDASGDFIRQRTLKEVWPKLAAFLVSQHSVSRNKGKAYEITAAFKYQLALLRGLGPLSHKLKVGERDVTLLASVVVPYMDTSQPKELQSAAVGCTEVLARCSPDSIWFFLMKTYCNCQHSWSPSPALHPVPFSQAPDLPNKNVPQVLEYLGHLGSS